MSKTSPPESERFDRLLKAMTEGEPHKAQKRDEKALKQQTVEKPTNAD